MVAVSRPSLKRNQYVIILLIKFTLDQELISHIATHLVLVLVLFDCWGDLFETRKRRENRTMPLLM